MIRAHRPLDPELLDEHDELILLRPLRPGLVGNLSEFLLLLSYCVELVKP